MSKKYISKIHKGSDDLLIKDSEARAVIVDLSTSKADSSTTLAGYGITDAKIESGTITLGSNTVTPLTSSNCATVAECEAAAGELT